jgi:hypothetical protein
VTEFVVTCPYCGEEVVISLEEDLRGSFVQDCEVCCNPWLLHLTQTPDGSYVTVTRAD